LYATDFKGAVCGLAIYVLVLSTGEAAG